MATTADIFKDMQISMREFMNGLAAYVPVECRDTMKIEQYDSFDEWDEGYELYFSLGGPHEWISARLLIIDSCGYDNDRPNRLVNISLEITGPDGLVLVHAVPYNYSERVWVSTANRHMCVDELRNRLDMLYDGMSEFGLRLSTGEVD